MHSRANSAKRRMFREACSAAKQEVRSVLCHSLVVDSTRENVAIHGEFEQLPLACSEGCGLHHKSIDSKFGAAFIYTCALY